MLQQRSVSSSHSTKSMISTKNNKKRTPVFPKRLYDMLENAERDGYDHIISWLPDGSGFKIHKDGTQCTEDEKEIVKVLKKAFNQTRFRSFLRQLQLYGFQRQFRGQRRGECKHVIFVRGQRDLLHKKSIEEFQTAAKNDNFSSNSSKTVVSLPTMPITRSGKNVRQVSLSSLDETARSSSQPSSQRSIGDNTSSWVPPLCPSASRLVSRCEYAKTSVIPTKLNNLVLPISNSESETQCYNDDGYGNEQFINDKECDNNDVFVDYDELSLAIDCSSFDTEFEQRKNKQNGTCDNDDFLPIPYNKTEINILDVPEWNTSSTELKILENSFENNRKLVYTNR